MYSTYNFAFTVWEEILRASSSEVILSQTDGPKYPYQYVWYGMLICQSPSLSVFSPITILGADEPKTTTFFVTVFLSLALRC